jgi:hypothetical protein
VIWRRVLSIRVPVPVPVLVLVDVDVLMLRRLVGCASGIRHWRKAFRCVSGDRTSRKLQFSTVQDLAGASGSPV